MKEFIDNFVNLLKGELELYVDIDKDGCGAIFIDEKEIQGGQDIPNTIAKALCESACMILVYAPVYFSESYPYCTREYLAMKILRECRVNSGNLSLIIPIILRGENKLPPELKNIKYYDFSEYQSNTPAEIKKFFKKKGNAEAIAEMAEVINEHFQQLSQQMSINNNCDGFCLPNEDEAKLWLIKNHIIATSRTKFPTQVI